MVKRRSVKRNAKNALGLGRDRAASLPFFPPPTSPFPSRSRLIFALLVLIRPRYTIWEPGTGYWKPCFWVEKRTRYLNVNQAAKNKLVLTIIWAYNPISWSAAALKALIIKKNCALIALSNKKSYITAFSPVRSSGTENYQFHTGSPKLEPRVVN